MQGHADAVKQMARAARSAPATAAPTAAAGARRRRPRRPPSAAAGAEPAPRHPTRRRRRRAGPRSQESPDDGGATSLSDDATIRIDDPQPAHRHARGTATTGRCASCSGARRTSRPDAAERVTITVSPSTSAVAVRGVVELAGRQRGASVSPAISSRVGARRRRRPRRRRHAELDPVAHREPRGLARVLDRRGSGRVPTPSRRSSGVSVSSSATVTPPSEATPHPSRVVRVRATSSGPSRTARTVVDREVDGFAGRQACGDRPVVGRERRGERLDARPERGDRAP